MSQNFLPCDRDQQMLLPADMREWLPEEHLAWFVLDAVEEMDLGSFFSNYRDDGWGRAAHDPEMMARSCSTPTPSASAPRGGSRGDAARMSPSG